MVKVRAQIVAGDGDPRHGTANGYTNLGCHCTECKAAHARNHRDWMRAHPARLAAHAERERIKRGGARAVKPAGYLSADEVGERAGCSASLVRYQRLAGHLVGHKVGAQWFYNPAEVKRWMAARPVRSAVLQRR